MSQPAATITLLIDEIEHEATYNAERDTYEWLEYDVHTGYEYPRSMPASALASTTDEIAAEFGPDAWDDDPDPDGSREPSSLFLSVSAPYLSGEIIDPSPRDVIEKFSIYLARTRDEWSASVDYALAQRGYRRLDAWSMTGDSVIVEIERLSDEQIADAARHPSLTRAREQREVVASICASDAQWNALRESRKHFRDAYIGLLDADTVLL